jgi:hypothetical protein
MKKNQRGFTSFDLILVLFIFSLIGYIGYLVYNHQQPGNGLYNPGRPGSQSAVASDVSKAPAINNTSDLDNASKVLDKNNPSASSTDAKQLDTQSSSF